MTRLLLRLAIGFARGWTAIYTWRLPPAIALERRREIDSDLAECRRDPLQPAGVLAAQVICRVLFGVPDDLGWRWTEASHERSAAAFVVIATAITLFAVWAMWLGIPRALPAVPPATLWQGRWTRAPMPVPPPPPPPPCPPAALDPNPVGCVR